MADTGGINAGYSGQQIDQSLLDAPNENATNNSSVTSDPVKELNQQKLASLAARLGFDKANLFVSTSDDPTGGALSGPVINIPDDLSQYSFTELTLIVTALLAAVTGKTVENEKIGLQDKAEQAQRNAEKTQEKLEEAQRKLEEAKKLGIWLQIASAILTVIVTVVSVIATIATLGTAAPVAVTLIAIALALTVAVAVTDAAGGFDALNEAISDALIEKYKSEGLTTSQAKKKAAEAATGASVGIQLGIAIIIGILTLGAGIAQSVANAAKTAAAEGAKVTVKEIIRNAIKEAFQAVKEAVKNIVDTIVDLAKTFADEGLKAGLDAVKDLVKEVVISILKGIWEGLKSAKQNVVESGKGVLEIFKKGSDTAATTLEKVHTAIRAVRVTTEVVGGVTKLGIAGGQFAANESRVEATQAQADAQEIAARLATLRALQESIQAFIEELLEFLETINSTAVTVINTEHEVNTRVANIPSNA